jgi:hypothetical protein
MHCPKNQLIRANHSAPSARPNRFPVTSHLLPDSRSVHAAAAHVPAHHCALSPETPPASATQSQSEKFRHKTLVAISPAFTRLDRSFWACAVTGSPLTGSSTTSGHRMDSLKPQKCKRHAASANTGPTAASSTMPASGILRKLTPVLGLSAMDPGGNARLSAVYRPGMAKASTSGGRSGGNDGAKGQTQAGRPRLSRRDSDLRQSGDSAQLLREAYPDTLP